MIRQLSNSEALASVQALGLSGAYAAELHSLSQETDLELREMGLLGLADRLADHRRLQPAAQIYQSILDGQGPENTRALARQRLDALSGQGNFGVKFEFFLGRLTEQALDPVALTTMTLGGTAFRLARLGALRAGAPRLLAPVLAWGTEVATFTLGGRLGAKWLGREHFTSLEHDLASSALMLGSLRLSAWAGTSALRKISGPVPQAGLSSVSTKAFPLAVQFGGISLGQGLEQSLGLRPPQGASGFLADAMGTLFHFQVAGQLAPRILGRKYSLWERQLDLQAESLSGGRRPKLPPWQAPLLAGAEGMPIPERPEALRLYSFSERHGSETPPPRTRVQALQERYLRLFPSPELGARSEEILQAACRIRCELPEFHERLLDALVRSSKAGSREQLYLVLAIEDVFSSDALRTATGSFDYAPLQLLVGRAIAESDASYRNQVLHKIFRGMEAGHSRDHWMGMAEQLGYAMEPPISNEAQYSNDFWRNHSAEAGQAWADYRARDQVTLFNFAYHHQAGAPRQASRIIQTFGAGRNNPRYPAEDFDAAMDYARNISHGELVLQRLHDILATGDSPAKLLEITRAPGSNPTLPYILNQLSRGRTRESLAFEINGSSHTAYFNDVRLARKVLSVFEDIAPYLHDVSLMQKNKARLVDAFKQWATQARPLDVPDLFKLLETNTHPVTESFTLAWMAKMFDVEILAPAPFDRRVAEWGRTKDCTESIFFPKGGSEGQPVILIRDIPDLDLGNEVGRRHAFGEVMSRVKGLAHEAEHWRHITGNFFGIERASRPLQLADVSREERYISEIMAYLEDFRWRARNLDLDFWEISRRLGEPLPVYLRGMADRSYFGASNETKALR